ncbi:hypothetical protein D9M70_331500 [compost metagenome]
MQLRDLHQCLADALESFAETFPPVACDEDQLTVRVKKCAHCSSFFTPLLVLVEARHHIEQSVDHGIAGNEDLFPADSFRDQVGLRGLRWREVPIGQYGSELAVALFRPGRKEVAGAQPRFHVRHRDLLVIGRKAGNEGCSGISVYEHHVWLELAEYAFHPLQDVAGDVGKVLARPHDVQVEVGPDTEQVEYLVKHFAVLAGDANLDLEALVCGQGKNEGGHLDGLGASAKDAEGFHAVVLQVCFIGTSASRWPAHIGLRASPRLYKRLSGGGRGRRF